MKKIVIIILLSVVSFIIGCSEDAKTDKGTGPVKELALGEIDKKLVSEGQVLFQKKCTTCHGLDQKKIGSALRGITKRRTPEWIMNMMLNPDGMINENKAAKELFEEMKVRMNPQDVNETDARKILEYLRTEN
ncbi:MAG: cytochrome c [Candidatus Kapaibacterium sp.]